MRVLVQVVTEASVTIDNSLYSSIGKGFLLFVGFTQGDDLEIMKKMADKVTKLRIFQDENGKTNKSLLDVNGSILSVSQFTLYGNAKEGNRPSFVDALKPDEARSLFALWNNLLKERFPRVETGVFQADMKIGLVNDGPFTLWLDSKDLWGK